MFNVPVNENRFIQSWTNPRFEPIFRVEKDSAKYINATRVIEKNVTSIYSGRLLESDSLSPRPRGNCKSVPHLINQRCTTLSFSSTRYISCQIQSHSELPRLALPSVAPSWHDSADYMMITEIQGFFFKSIPMEKSTDANN